MTGIYWAWKNDRTSDFVGFCHYRRLFSFHNHTNQRVDVHGMVYADRIGRNFEQDFGLDLASVQAAVTSHNIILPHHFDVRTADMKSVRDQYIRSPGHHAAHLDLARRALFALAPADLKWFDEVMADRFMYPANMFIMSRLQFDRYCEWIFPLLFWLEDRIDPMGLLPADRRAVGYLAERLFSVYILKLRKSDPSLHMLEAARVFVRNTAPAPSEPPLPVTELPVISVVASTDEAYAPHLAALTISLATTINAQTWLDLIILCGTLTAQTRRNIESITDGFPNMSVSFVEMEGEFASARVHSYFQKATLYRLNIAEVLQSRDRIVFIDTDGIVTQDIAQLRTLDLEGNIVAAVHDATMESFRNKKVPVLAECGNINADTYCTTYLGMGQAAESYFQGGFLVMDIAAIRREKLSQRMITDVLSRPYWFLDQDVLNKHLVGHVKFLDMKWNFVYLDAHHRSYLPNGRQVALDRAQSNPAFIHFAGYGKPWNAGGHPRSQDYWSCLRQTPFYESMLLQALRSATPQSPPPQKENGPLSRFARRVHKRFAKLSRSIKKRVRLRR
jgi:lipopolysaccharide biosynthesis glycosyltransferase